MICAGSPARLRRELGLAGQLALTLGVGGLWRMLQSERVFASKYMGYGIVVGVKN